VTIGPHGSPWTADQARRRAFEILGQVRTGIDPLSARQRASDDAIKAKGRRDKRLFEIQAERWLDGHVRGRLKSESDIEGVVRRDLLPAFAGISIDEMTREDVGFAIDAIGRRSKSAANKAHKWLRQMFNWLIEKGVIDKSPLDRTSRPFEEESRSRVLGLLELMVVWNAAAQLHETFRDYYRSLILLGQRLREVSNAPWREIDRDVGEWLIPKERSKSGRPHLVPLSDEACALLDRLAQGRDDPQGPIFTTDGRVGISGFSKMKEALDLAVNQIFEANPEIRKLLGGTFAPWVVHDLRRSIATGCQAMKIDLVVTEAVLSHVSGQRGGIRKVYQLYDYFEEKADALARWGKLLSKALALWEKGEFTSIMDLDPIIKAKRERRARRSSLITEA
jgi:integrase